MPLVGSVEANYIPAPLSGREQGAKWDNGVRPAGCDQGAAWKQGQSYKRRPVQLSDKLPQLQTVPVPNDNLRRARLNAVRIDLVKCALRTVIP